MIFECIFSICISLTTLFGFLSFGMAVFFQNVSDDQFNAAADFVVKESKGVNIVTGIFFLMLSLGVASMAWYGWLFVVPAVTFIARGFQNKVIMVVNSNGFYYYGQLITDWDDFISEQFIDDGPDRRGNDKFYLFLKYYKEGQPGYFGRKIPFTVSQDKSEEEIMAAIKFYYKNHEKVSQ